MTAAILLKKEWTENQLVGLTVFSARLFKELGLDSPNLEFWELPDKPEFWFVGVDSIEELWNHREEALWTALTTLMQNYPVCSICDGRHRAADCPHQLGLL